MSENQVQLSIESITFVLKEAHDFGWLREIGSPFVVFDQQDSGNLCFGVQREGARLFVKYAGARTIDYSGSIDEAISRLRRAIGPYTDLRHDNLISFRRSVETPSGFAAVFDWFDGECFHPHWVFPPPAKYADPRSPVYRFRRLPVADRIRAVDGIMEFHAHVEEKGYVAVDFYDGSIMYDFQQGVVKVCDIDCYERRPFHNSMGRMWGSSRFMSPEEFVLGAPIDQRSNVFCMGSTAFCLLGAEKDHSRGAWEASERLYSVALRAVSPAREDRYGTVADLLTAWKEAP